MIQTPPPTVAARGLWDKFSDPGSLAAIRRSYQRGVASVADTALVPLADVAALVSDRTVNRRRQPVYLRAATLPSEAMLAGVASEPAVFVAVVDHANLPCAMWRWTGHHWTAAGVYVPVQAAVGGPTTSWPVLRSATHAMNRDTSAPGPVLSKASSAWAEQVLFESPNVITVLSERARLGELDEAAIVARLRAYAGPTATITRVSDFVEAEQLHAVAEMR